MNPTREQLMRLPDSELRARAYADRMTAGYLYTEARCETHGVIDEPDEGEFCPVCGESCDFRAVCR